MMTGRSGTASENSAIASRGRNRRQLASLLLASTILGCATVGTVPLALAQQGPRLAAADQAVQFSIPSQSLSSAIDAFIRQTGWQISYSSALANGKTSGSLVGFYTPAQALQRLVAGTGLGIRVSSPGSAALVAPGVAAIDTLPPVADGSIVLDTIDVTGGSGESSVYSPYETAAPTSHIAAENIERFRGSSPADIFRGTAGVMSGEARNGAGSIDVNIRGMQGMGRVATTIDGAENNVTVYQGYQGVSNRTFVDPDFIAGVDITKGADAGSWGNAGSVSMRTLSADDIVKPGDTWGLRVKGGFGTNTSKPNAGDIAGYRYVNGNTSITQSETGMDRPSLFSPTSGSGSAVAAYKGENIDFLAGYARRKQGNYHAGKNGPSADPENVGDTQYCSIWEDGVCTFWRTRSNTWVNNGLANYRAGEEVLNTQLETESWLTKLTARFAEDHTLQLGYTGYRSEAGDRLASRLTSNTGQATQQEQTVGTSLDTFTARYHWNPVDNDLFDLKANAYWTHLQLRNPVRGGGGATAESIGLPSGFRVGSDTDMWGADVTNLSKISFDHGNLDLTYGLSYRAEDTRGSRHTGALEGWLTPRDAIRHEAAGFVKGSYKPLEWDWLTLNAGLRYSHFWSKDRVDPYERSQIEIGNVIPGFKTDAGGFSPSVGVTLEPFDGTQFYVNYSNAMRAPSIIESVSAFNSVVANAGVKPERSSNWEIGANFIRDGLLAQDDRAMLKLGYFNWDVKDYLARDLIVDLNNPTLLSLNISNIHRAKFSGLELAGRYEIGGFTAELAANYFLNVEYCRTADTCDSKTLYGDYATNHVQPKYTIDLTLSQKLFEERFTVGGRISHVGPRAIGHGEVTATGASQFIAMVDWKPYTLVDVFAEYKINDNFTAAFRVENLFDRYYVDPLGLVTQPGPGRTFYASLTGNFGGDQKLPQLPAPFGRAADRAAGTADWSGLFAGVHAGGVFGRASGSTTALDGTPDAIAATESANLGLDGTLFGVQAGYNWQLDNRLVLGVEADWSKTHLQGTQKAVSTEGTLANAGALQAQTVYDIDWTSSIRGRVGYAVDNRWMVYGTGGLALARETQSREQYRSTNGATQELGTETTVSDVEQASKTRIGWTAGGGVEYAINDRWSINANYAYTRFGKTNFNFENAREGASAPYRTQELDYYRDPVPRFCDLGYVQYCEPTPVYKNVDHAGSANTINGRKASNKLDFHTIKIGLNYRF